MRKLAGLMTIKLTAISLAAFAITLSVGAVARVNRPHPNRVVVARGSWTVPGELDSNRKGSKSRWQVQIRLAPDGAVSGRGRVRVGDLQGAGNVVGQVSGHRLTAELLTDDGQQIASIDAAITEAGLRGTFVALTGDSGTFVSTRHEMRELD